MQQLCTNILEGANAAASFLTFERLELRNRADSQANCNSLVLMGL